MITHSAKETSQLKEQWGEGLEVTGKRGGGGGVSKIGNRGVFIEKGFGTLSQL